MSQSRNNWSQAEDDIIKEFVLALGQKKWTKISKAIQDRLGTNVRTGKQCRERWHNHLNPDISKDHWTEDEELKIFELQKQFGNKWSEIATHMPGRNDNSIKNCFYSALRRNLRRYNKRKPECEKLKGPIKSLLRKPHVRSILMQNTSELESEEESVEKSETPVSKPKIKRLDTLDSFQVPTAPSTSHSLLPGTVNFESFSCFEGASGFDNSLPVDFSVYDAQEMMVPQLFMLGLSPGSQFQFYY